MIRFLGLGIVSFLMIACATTDNYRLALNSWRGSNINQLVQVWGYPDANSIAPDGNKLYIYRFEERGTNPVYATASTTDVVQTSGGLSVTTMPGMMSGGGSYDFNCTTWVEVDDRGIIIGTNFRGNNCVATEAFVNTHGNPNVLKSS